MALVVSMTAGAQGTSIHEYPWNPDSNNDNFVGTEDLAGFLSAFGSEFGNPPEPCDYDGTPYEDWWSMIVSGEIIVDSLFIEFQLVDSSLVFQPGCPEPLMEVAEISWAAMLYYHSSMDVANQGQGPGFYGSEGGSSMFWTFQFDGTDGTYVNWFTCGILNTTGYAGDGLFGSNASWVPGPDVQLPFPETWYLDEEGIHMESGWDESQWPYYANYLHILPYWHYAE